VHRVPTLRDQVANPDFTDILQNMPPLL